MNVTINIPTPVLVSGQSFNVRYRLLPAGSWVNISPKTNTPFTITGLAAGEYELEVAVNLGGSPAVVCAPTYQLFDVTEDPECLGDIVAEVKANANYTQYWIEVEFNNPTTPASCGYEIWIIKPGSNSANIIQFPGIPPTNPVIIPVSGDGPWLVIVYAKKCDGSLKECYNEVAPSIYPTCTPAVLGTPYITSISGQWRLIIPFTNSNPASVYLTATWQQNGPVLSGIPDPGGTNSFYSLNQGSISIPITPNENTQPNQAGVRFITYAGSIVDACGKSHPFSAGYSIVPVVQPQYISVVVNNKHSFAVLTTNAIVKEQSSGTQITPSTVKTLQGLTGWTVVSNAVKNTNLYRFSMTISAGRNPEFLRIYWVSNGVTTNLFSSAFTFSPPHTITDLNIVTPLTGSGTLFFDFSDS
jgi:hypothetical protein